MGAPGAGKTTVLERVVGGSGRARRCARGRRAGQLDADRIAALHVPVTQINTDPSFGGECHLDANMVRSALPVVAARRDRPARDRERRQPRLPGRVPGRRGPRVMVSSVTEGEDKPLKYPLMFRACELVLVNKIDLLPHLDFDLDSFLHNLDAVTRASSACWSARARRGRRGVPRLADRAASSEPRPRRQRPARRAARAGSRQLLERGAARRARATSRPRRGGSRELCQRWPSGSRAAGACSRSAGRRRRGRTRATSRSSSSIR